MFCPSCGFEYTQKTNYCKRCGGNLGLTSMDEPHKMERPKLGVMVTVIAVFGIAGMSAAFAMLDMLAGKGLRGDDLIIPFVMTLIFTGAIAGLLIWQLSRLITAYQKTERNVVVEKYYIRETPPAQLGATSDPIQQVVEPPSVIEHTTRQLAGK